MRDRADIISDLLLAMMRFAIMRNNSEKQCKNSKAVKQPSNKKRSEIS